MVACHTLTLASWYDAYVMVYCYTVTFVSWCTITLGHTCHGVLLH
jgi:hypothetical protein